MNQVTSDWVYRIVRLVSPEYTTKLRAKNHSHPSPKGHKSTTLSGISSSPVVVSYGWKRFERLER